MDISKASSQELALEYLNCKYNFLYFLHSYVKLPEVGGGFLYTPELLHPKFKRTIQCSLRFGRVILMATRQLGKSSIAAALIEYFLNFYPNNRAIILNMSKTAGLENINKIRFIHDNLPKFLRSAHKNRSADRKTFLEYDNGSKVNVFFPSSATSPDTLARSLSSPILYVDEAAFVRHIEAAWGSAAPVLAKAREQARRNGYHDLMLLSSTPNGTEGEGKFFYDMWNNAIDSDEIYDENNKLVESASKIIAAPSKNGFISVKFHWSELKDDVWYANQCKDLNFVTRRINQELDLLFVGGTHCLFEDDFLAALRTEKPIEYHQLPHQTKLKIFKELSVNDYYLVGVDSARSLTGDFAVIEVYQYSNFEQVAEFSARLGSIPHFAEIVKSVSQYIISIVGERLKLGVENNSIGAAVVDLLIEDEEYDYIPLLYKTRTKTKEDYGITTGKNKDEMITYFYDYVTKNPELLHSSELISQLSVIEKKSGGRIAAALGHHDDLFMASCFCAYLKKQCQLEIGPLINSSQEEVDNQYVSKLQSILSINSATINNSTSFKDQFQDVKGFEYSFFGGIGGDDDDESFDDLPFWYSQ